jgi:hypothetical protein
MRVDSSGIWLQNGLSNNRWIKIKIQTQMSSLKEENKTDEIALNLTTENLNFLMAGLNALTKAGMGLSDTATVVALANKLSEAAKS